MDCPSIRTVSNSSANSLFSNTSTASTSSPSLEDAEEFSKHTPALKPSIESLPARVSPTTPTQVEDPPVKRPASTPSLILDFDALPQLSPTRRALQKRKSMYLANCNDTNGSINPADSDISTSNSSTTDNSTNNTNGTLPALQPPPVFGLGLSNKPNNNTRPKKTQPSLTPEQAIALANEQLSRPSMKTGTASSETTMGKRKRHPPPLLGLVLGYSLYTYRGSAPVFASLLLTVIVLLYALIHVADDNKAHETAHNRSTTSSNTGSSGISSSSAAGKKKGGHRRANSVIPPTRIDTTTSAAASAAAAVPGSPTRRRHARRRSQSPVRLEPAPVFARLSGAFVEGPVLQYQTPQSASSSAADGSSHARKQSVASIGISTGFLAEEEEELAGFRPYPVNSWRV